MGSFLIELLEWGSTFSDFWDETVLHIILRLANVPEFFYCRRKVKCFTFDLKNVVSF